MDQYIQEEDQLMNKISIIIPCYKEESLDLCLKSCIEGCSNLNNIEIIVVVDGFYDFNKPILDKYKDYIKILNLHENVGMIRAMNLGTYNASYNLLLHAQDDNVFGFEYDKKILEVYQPNSVLTINQIEPIPSIFPQMNIKNLGRDPNIFDLGEFWKYEISQRENKIDDCGSTFPFLISKQDYLKVGGFDESYPSPWVVDTEFFMKCKLSGMKMLRTYNCHFYHFVSLSSSKINPEKQIKRQKDEMESHEYFKYKWGDFMKRDIKNNVFVK